MMGTNSARRLGRVLLVVAATASAGWLTAIPGAALPKAPSTEVFDVAGADLVSVRIDGGALSLRVRDAGEVARGAPGRDPGAVPLRVDPGAAASIPGGPEFAFLGPVGSRVWTLTRAGSPFPAWDTTGVPAGALTGGAVRVRVREVAGPGRFHAYALSPVGTPTPLLGTAGAGPEVLSLAAGVRRGGAIWAFSAPGAYTVTLAASAVLRTGGTVTTEATYRVEVPDSPVRSTPPGSPVARSVPRGPATTGAGQAVAAPPPPVARGPAPGRAGTDRLAARAPEAQATGRVVAADGHIDIGPRFVNGAWTIQIRDDRSSPPVWRSVPDVVLHAVNDSKIQVPSGSEYSFLGSPGADVWMLPQVQRSGVLWPGWNTQDPSVVSGVRAPVVWTLRSVTGPGKFVLFLTGSFGRPEVLFNAAQALPQRMNIPLNTHAHGNWAFTRPGVYRLTIEMSATATDGRAVSDTRTLAVAVGATNPQDAFPGGSGGGGGLPRTGSNLVIPLTAAGAVLVLAGVVLVVVTRRRRRRTGSAT